MGYIMKRFRNGSTDRQKAYAQRRLLGIAQNKKQTALSVGYSPAVANSVVTKIESTEGYANAVRDLAQETGNLILHSYNTLKNRNLDNEPTLVVLKSIDTLVNAWQILSKDTKNDQEPNRLRLALQQNIKQQVINVSSTQENTEKAI